MKAIVTTTIHPPTEAIKKFKSIDDWTLYVVGDKRTPHHLYESDSDLVYLHPDQQQNRYPKISSILGWNNIQRRNIGFIQAIKDGAELIATVDDDNIPLNNWGKNLTIGTDSKITCYENRNGLFDPISQTSISDYWHRGYPLQLCNGRFDNEKSIKKFIPKIQANMWNGKPDVDAVSKLMFGYRDIDIQGNFPFCSSRTVFSSQNAFIHRDLMQHYSVLPFCGRMDDIWGCIVLQYRTNESVVFGPSSTYHDRNYHDLIDDLKQEIIGYKSTMDLLEKGESILPLNTRLFIDEYQKEMTC